MKGFFGNLFDMNYDGKLDMFEKTTDFAAFASMMDETERQEAIEDAELAPDDFNF